MRALVLPRILVAMALAAGCTGTIGYSTAVPVADYGPELVYAAPGVQVIADFNEPIFFVDNFYWRYDGVTWYRSSYYAGGWAYAAPPPVLVGIDRPQRFAHYRPHGWTPGHGPRVRDHREPSPRANRQPPPRYTPPPGPSRRPPAPPPRDHRDDRGGDRGGDRDHRDHRDDRR